MDVRATMPNELLGTGVATVSKNDLPADTLHAVFRGAVVARAGVSTIEVKGSRALQCMQGVLTNDVVSPGDASFIYGAVLTAKGRIVSDMWVARIGERLLLFPPRQGGAAVLETFRRTIPPRLAKISDLSSEIDVLRIVGPNAVTVATNAGLMAPERGGLRGVGDCMVARPTEEQPFVLQIACNPNDTDTHIATLAAAGAVTSDDAALEIQRVVAGWPRLGSEIDGKTLPQEVLYDELGGVSYSKGCYTGQETVARLHFRGHVNKRIVGLRWDGNPDVSAKRILQDNRDVGRVSSIVWLGSSNGYVGLGMVHRNVALGESVTAGGVSARVVGLPLEVA